MKVKRILGAALAAALALAVSATAAAASSDPSGYGFQAGKLGRTEESIPYAGMNYEGGEQGETPHTVFGLAGSASLGTQRNN